MIAYDHDGDSAIFDSKNNTNTLVVHVPYNVRHLIVEFYADLKDDYCELDNFEVDLFACLLDSSGRVPNNEYMMFYNNSYLLESDSSKEYYIDRRWIWGFPDEVAGAYYLHLDILPEEIESIVFFCSIYDAKNLKYDYDMCNYVRMRIGDSSLLNPEGNLDGETEKRATLAQWEESSNLKNVSVISFATLQRTTDGWDVLRNEGSLYSEIEDVCRSYGVQL